MKNKLYPKIVSSIVCAALVIASAGAVLVAQPTEQKETLKEDAPEKTAAQANASSAEKEETVYVIAAADGSVKKIIVSDWLKNPGAAAKMEDYSILRDASNVKNDNGYSMNPDNTLVWDADGKDVYYQGTADKPLPVDVSVGYTLDGKSISAEQLAGKSGKVKITFTYQNNETRTVRIKEQDEEVCVPFLLLTGTILDNEKFTNIEVSNGKLVNDGDRSIVMGFALPGLQESLAVPKEDFELPETIEITADVKDFSLETTVTLATNELFSGLDTGKLDGIDKLSDSLDELSGACGRLADGSSTLYEGLTTLLDKSGSLISGIGKLAAGSGSLKNGADDLQNGTGELEQGVLALVSGASGLKEGSEALFAGSQGLVSGAQALQGGAGNLLSGTEELKNGAEDLENGAKQLDSGAQELSDGLKALTNNNASLVGGAEQVFGSLLAAANSQIKAAGLEVPELTVENYGTVLNNVIASLDKDKITNFAYNTALEKVTAAVKAQESAITQKVTDAVRAKVLEGVLAAAGRPMTAEEYAAAVEAGRIPEQMQAQIAAGVTAQMETGAVKAQIAAAVAQQEQTLVAQNMESEEVQAQIAAAVAQAAAGKASLQTLQTQLANYQEFYDGLKSYTQGVSDVYAGSKTLKAGTEDLFAGAQDLNAGSKKLHNGAQDLYAGTGTLLDGTQSLFAGTGDLTGGSKQLYDGTKELHAGVLRLKDGATALAAGAAELEGGIGALKEGSAALVDGVKELKKGSMQLSDGMKEFQENGVQKLLDIFQGDVKGLTERVKAVVGASKEYNNYSGIQSGAAGSVRFLYRTESIH